MPYRDMFNNQIYHNQFDEDMSRKHPQTYQSIKSFYPDIYKLPEDEVANMCSIMRNKGDTFDEGKAFVQSHITQNEPMWKNTYFNDNKQPTQGWLSDSFNQNLQNADDGNNLEVNNHLEWDGKNLRWIKNGEAIKSWAGMSGIPAYQCAKYQNLYGKGPIPEGSYQLKKSNLQNMSNLSFKDRLINQIEPIFRNYNLAIGKWPGGVSSWGNRRIWLDPEMNTNVYGRNKFSIHGGDNLGSAGCIDLINQMDDFAKDYENYGKDMELVVKYPQECW